MTLPRPSLAVEVARNRTLAAAALRRHSLAVRAPAAVSYLRTLAASAAHARRAARRDDSGSPHPLALRRRARRRLGRPPRIRSGAPARAPGRDRLADRHVSRAARRPRIDLRRHRRTRDHPDRRHGALGSLPRHRGPGHQDRDSSTTASTRRTRTSTPSGFSYPAGFPKGNTAYTTPKVIVARAFPSPSTHWKYADRPFDPDYSFHATHVAGIAAGDYDTPTAASGGSPISGVAPKAYLGNYKALTVPTADFGLDGNSPEIAKAIDQAVADGMNVINLSIGEPEVAAEPRHRRQGARQRRGRRGRPGRRRRERLRRRRARLDRLAGNAPAAITVAASTWASATERAGPHRRLLVRRARRRSRSS